MLHYHYPTNVVPIINKNSTVHICGNYKVILNPLLNIPFQGGKGIS